MMKFWARLKQRERANDAKIDCRAIGLAVAACGSVTVSAARAGTVIDDWANIKAPPPPALKAVTVDPSTTALLLLDFVHPSLRSAKEAALRRLAAGDEETVGAGARQSVMVVYSTAGNMTAKDIWADVAPLPGEPVVNSHADKFQDTDLEKILKDKGIKTVIVTGVNANGAVFYTASDAALRGFKVIDPIDGFLGRKRIYRAICRL